MTARAIDVLSAVRAAGGDVKVSGGRLRLIAPAPLPAEMVEMARVAKPALLALLSNQTGIAVARTAVESGTVYSANPAKNPKPQRDAPPEWTAGVLRLRIAQPPGDVPPRRWQRLAADSARFLTEGWAETALALGWNAIDLFGCNPDRPFARIDQAGLLWLLDGFRIIALTDREAALESPSGARQTFRRRPMQHGQALAWDLAP